MQKTAISTTVQLSEKMALTTEDLQAVLSCGRASAVEIGMRAEARIQLGKRVLWNADKVRNYLNCIASA